ncbi:fumarate hydratase C-terminal domain-containing protein [Eubacterium sp.]|uniref:fumarate hydratase C-terminal domain-containing protein n=1 Tax=Eubacterium sp. TaxID=142586 RepID=UPI00399BF38D
MAEIIRLSTPISEKDVESLNTGDMILVSGKIYCGRDAVLPKICKMIEGSGTEDIKKKLKGSIIFHTAVSPAGVGPTSSNKLEIESSIPALSEAGVKIHLGKGQISKKTIDSLDRNNSVYAVIPPVTALLGENTISQKLVAFPELGMEAFYELEVRDYPMIIAAAHNQSIY